MTFLFSSGALFWAIYIVVKASTRSVAVALTVALLKVVSFYIFFEYIFEGCVTCVDDLYYLKAGELILSYEFGDYNASSVYWTLVKISEGIHIGYPLINAFAIWFIENSYYAPVCLNVFLAVLCAIIARNIAVENFRWSSIQANKFFVFFALHPELLAWSTVLNGKDTVILLLHLVFLQAFSSWRLGETTKGLVLFSFVFFVSLAFRFYLIVLFTIILVLFALLFIRGFKFVFLTLFFSFVLFLTIDFYIPWLDYASNLFLSTKSNPIYGITHFLLTPRPFFIDPVYYFLYPSALSYWILFPLTFLGWVELRRQDSQFFVFIMIYFLIFVLFYGSFDALQGPRHRFQLFFVIALIQWLGLVCVAKDFTSFISRRGGKNDSMDK